jgi:hypothetical protein
MCAVACLVLSARAATGADGGNTPGANGTDAPRVLIVGLDDNVKSNYFHKGMIAEETGMNAEHIDLEYNRIIAENIAACGRPDACSFIPANPEDIAEGFMRSVRLSGEEEAWYSDLSSVPPDEWESLLRHAGADYMLVLNRHYLKWQETPLRTLFHIVSYTLFDENRKEICRGNSYFAGMSLEKPEKLRKISRKSSSRIAAGVIRSIR